MAKGPRRSRSPKYDFQGLINALTWSNMFCRERGRRGGMVGPMVENCHFNKIFMKSIWGLYIQPFPLGKAHKGHTFQHLYDVMNFEKQVHPTWP